MMNSKPLRATCYMRSNRHSPGRAIMFSLAFDCGGMHDKSEVNRF